MEPTFHTASFKLMDYESPADTKSFIPPTASRCIKQASQKAL